MTALGLFPHTGWTWIVRVRAGALEARDKVVAVPVLEAELYHHARDHGVQTFAAHSKTALAAAIAAVRPYADAKHAVVIGKQPALPPIDKIVASHAMIHTAEGELWRALFAEALAACGVAVVRMPPDAIAISDAWPAPGPPWTREVKLAASAAADRSASRAAASTSSRGPSRPRGTRGRA